MDDVELTNGPPEGLFFAGSDDEGEEAVMDTAPETPAPSSSASSPPAALFITGSDDEDMVEVVEVVTPLKQKRRLSLPAEDDSDSGTELPTLKVKERAHSVQSVDKMSVVSGSLPAKASASPPPPLKKRRISVPPPAAQPTYLGDILVPNAWSNVSGKGYVKPNESVQIKRDEQIESRPGPSKAANSQGKKKGDNKKQMSLTTMLKTKPAKSSKKTKADNIVRLFNSRGFGNIFV
jgi:DNA repair protein RAD5